MRKYKVVVLHVIRQKVIGVFFIHFPVIFEVARKMKNLHA